MPHHFTAGKARVDRCLFNKKETNKMFGINKTAISLALCAIITAGCGEEECVEDTSDTAVECTETTTSTSTVTSTSTYYTSTGTETGSTTGTETGATTGTSTGTSGTTTTGGN